MKITMFTENFLFFGGGERHVYQLSKLLSNKEHTIKIVTSWGKNEKISENRIQVKRAFLGRRPFSLIKSCLISNFALEAMNQDIVHVHGFYAKQPVAGALWAKTLFMKPVVVTLHSFNPGLSNYYKRTLPKIDTIIAVSESVKLQYQNICNIQMKVIPNGVDTELFNPNANGKSLIDFYRLKDKFVVLFVGRLAKEKGIINLLYAIPKVLRIVKNVVFVFVGDGPAKQDLLLLSEKLGISDKIIITGFKRSEELPAIYAACDVFILPSASEAFPLVLLEAMACAKPVICANIGGTDIIGKSVISFIEDPNSIDSISESILKAYLKSNELFTIGLIGRQIAERHSWDSVIERTIDEYRKLI